MKKYIIVIMLMAGCAMTTQLMAQIHIENDASHTPRQGDKLRVRNPTNNDLLKEHTLFLVDEKIYNYQAFENLMKSPDSIQSIHILKDPEQLKQYTSDKKYQAILKVTLKK